MNRFARIAAVGSLTGMALIAAPAQANALSVEGTLYLQGGGTTFDSWKLDIQSAGTFVVNLLAYEASQSNTATAGYFSSDLNGDGELTWLDPDTHLYLDTGTLDAASHLARCDDIANNCATVNTSTLQLTSLDQTQGAADGSIHVRRDPAFEVTLAEGRYLFVVSDYRLTDAEAAAGINTGDTFSAPTGYIDPLLDHADYRITLSSDTLNFQRSGDTITVSAVPIPAAIWLFGAASTALFGIGRRKTALA